VQSLASSNFLRAADRSAERGNFIMLLAILENGAEIFCKVFGRCSYSKYFKIGSGYILFIMLPQLLQLFQRVGSCQNPQRSSEHKWTLVQLGSYCEYIDESERTPSSISFWSGSS